MKLEGRRIGCVCAAGMCTMFGQVWSAGAAWGFAAEADVPRLFPGVVSVVRDSSPHGELGRRLLQLRCIGGCAAAVVSVVTHLCMNWACK